MIGTGGIKFFFAKPMLWARRHPPALNRHNNSNVGQQIIPLHFAEWVMEIAVDGERCNNAEILERLHWALPDWTLKQMRTGQGDESGAVFRATHQVQIAARMRRRTVPNHTATEMAGAAREEATHTNTGYGTQHQQEKHEKQPWRRTNGSQAWRRRRGLYLCD